MRSKWCLNLGNANLFIQLHTSTYTLAYPDEDLIQNRLFSQSSKASITASTGIMIIHSVTAAQHGSSRQCS